MHKLNNLQNKVNNELKLLQPQYLKPEGVAEIPENILPEETRKKTMHVIKKVTIVIDF